MRDLLRLLRLLRPHWLWVLLGIGLSLLTLVANIGLLALSSWFIASMAIAGAAHLTMDFTLPSTGVRGLALGRTAGRYAERLVNHNTTFRVLAELRLWLFNRLEPLAPARLSRYRSGDLLSRVRADVDALDELYVRAFVPIVVAVLAVILLSLFIAGYSIMLMVVDLLGLLLAGALLPLLLQRLGRRPGRERVDAASELRSAVIDAVQGSAELIAFGALESHRQSMVGASARLAASDTALGGLEGAADGGMILASGGALWAGALLLVPQILSGRLPPADFAMLSVLLLASFEAVMPLPAVFKRLEEMARAAGRLFELIDAEPAVVEPVGAEPAVAEPEGRARASLSSALADPRRGLELAVKGLHFRYADNGPWIIDDLSFTAEAGARVAIVGPTGAGKSSLVNLLLRFWEYPEGSIQVGGVELRTLAGVEARRIFSVSEQTPYLFHSSLRENLLVGAPDADDAELLRVIEQVQLSPLIESMADGLDTVVGEQGLRLSAGQVRRLAVARALLKPAPVLVLDEPTQGLDDPTANGLLAAIDRESRGRTLVIISHRARDRAIADSSVHLRLTR